MDFTLQILHASDLEGGVDAIGAAPNFAAVISALEAEAEADTNINGSITLSAGDNFISGPFFNAASDPTIFNSVFEGLYNTVPIFDLNGDGIVAADEVLVDISAVDVAIADTDGNSFLSLDEIDAFLLDPTLNTTGLTAADVFVTDINGDGFPDFFDEIDNFQGRVDISILNVIGLDASALGNHEFDLGTDTLENIINYDSEEGNSLSSTGEASILAAFAEHVNFLQEVDFPGVQFPYLSANLDFSADPEIGNLADGDGNPSGTILQNTAFASDLLSARNNPADPAETASDSNDDKLAPSTFIEVDGELIGVVGATTPLLEAISSPGLVEVLPASDLIADLADIINTEVAELQALDVDGDGTGGDINKVILTSHLQDFTIETLDLAPLLSGVDVIIAGGSDQLLFDQEDLDRGLLQPGDDINDAFDVDQDPSNGITPGYPFFTTDADSNPLAVVSTDGEYSYVGRLVIDFDDNGLVVPGSVDETVSGAFSSTDAQVAALFGDADPFADGTSQAIVQDLVNAVTVTVIAQDGNIVGESDVFLNGARTDVRNQETNFGNLTADANLFVARQVEDVNTSPILVSLKNGGGIRDIIGFIGQQDDGTVVATTTQANPAAGKEVGDISQLDIGNTLRFDNDLELITLTPEQLLEVLEHSVAATNPPTSTDPVDFSFENEPGQFAQVGNIRFSFDPTQAARTFDPETLAQVTAGERIQSVAVFDDSQGIFIPLVENGAVVADAPTAIRVVTLDFLEGGGDAYPFEVFEALDPEFYNEVDLTQVITDEGVFNFSAPGNEQDALAEFLAVEFPNDADNENDFDVADVNPTLDTRIQNLAFREDTVFAPEPPAASGEITLTQVGTIDNAGDAEIVDFDATTNRLFVTGGSTVEVLDISDPTSPSSVSVLDFADPAVLDSPGFTVGSVNSVAVSNAFGTDGINGIVAVGLENDDESAAGQIAFVNTDTLTVLATIEAGLLPDAVSFSPDGTTLVVANEAEGNDAEGSISVIELAVVDGTLTPTATLLDFTAFNGQEDTLRESGVRITEGLTAAQDFEPEFGAISPDGSTAFVTLQENNAIAVVDLSATPPTISEILPLGTKDFSVDGNELDPSDQDGGDGEGEINIANFPVTGFFQPDAIDTFTVGGETFIITANEGDGRDDEIVRLGQGEVQQIDLGGATDGTFTLSFGGFTTTPLSVNATAQDIENALEGLDSITDVDVAVDADDSSLIEDIEVEFDELLANTDVDLITVDGTSLAGSSGPTVEVDTEAYILDTTVFPDALDLKKDNVLGRLEVSAVDGDTDGDGDIDQIFAFGGRSFSVRSTDGTLLFESGNQFAAITADQAPLFFNANNGAVEDFDERSDDAGAEPEAVVVGEVNGIPYGFIAPERGPGGIFVYNLSDPTNPTFVQYLVPPDADGDSVLDDAGPEGLSFIPASDSPSGLPLLAVAYEESSTTTVYEVSSLLDGDDTLVFTGVALNGGLGNDTIDFSTQTEGIIVDLDINSAGGSGTPSQSGATLDAPPAAGGNPIVALDDFEHIIGSDFNDGLFGNNEVNNIQGGLGDDTIHGFGGADTLDGGEGTDTLLFSAAGVGVNIDLAAGTTGPNTTINFENATGSANNDTITGDTGNNTLLGNAGDDILTGNGGDDTLDGGEGFDTAVFDGAQADFTITEDGTNTTVTGATGTTTLTNVEVLEFSDALIPDTLTVVEAAVDGTVENGFILNTAPVGANGEATATLTDDVLNLGNDAVFDNLVGFYQISDSAGGIDTDGDGIADVSPGDAGYAEAALANLADNFEIRAGSSGDPGLNTTAVEFGNAVLAGGQLFAPVVLANGGADGFAGFQAAEAAEADGVFNDAADFVEDQVLYFSFLGANPDGVAHLQSLGNNVFGFEDLPSNLGVSDNDFNDAVFSFSFTG